MGRTEVRPCETTKDRPAELKFCPAKATKIPKQSQGRTSGASVPPFGPRLACSELRDSADQPPGHGSVVRQANRALLDLESSELVAQSGNQRPGRRIDRVVVCPGREVDDGLAADPVGGNAVADRLDCFRQRLPDRRADAPERRTHRWWS